MSASAAAQDHSPLPSGFAELYAEHYDFVWRCALRLGAAPADVEDVVQETFMVALRRYHPADFRHGGARPSTWLFAILRNVLRNHARGERRRRARLEALAEIDEPPGSDAQSALGLRLLDEFLGELEPDRRAVFVLAELEGMRGPEIARALELNANTVRSRLRAARQAFEARFEGGRESIVDVAANDAAPREVRARGLMLLALALEPAKPVSGAAKLGWLASARAAVNVAIGAALVAGVGLLIAGAEPTRTKPRRPIDSARIHATASTEPRTGEPSLPAPSQPEPTLPEPITIQDPPRAAAPSKPAPKLDTNAALERLTDARAALLVGDAKACLALVEDQRGWPASLDARRVALEIGALCTLGRPERARARAESWLAAHPGARTAVDLRAACWSDADNTAAASGHQATNGPVAREELR